MGTANLLVGAASAALFPPYKRYSHCLSRLVRPRVLQPSQARRCAPCMLVRRSESEHPARLDCDQISAHMHRRGALGDRYRSILVGIGLYRTAEIRVVPDHFDRHVVKARAVELLCDL